MLAGARAAWEWRTIDAELAELLEEEQLAMRSVLNTVTLSAGDIFIDVDRHDAAAGTTHLVGQVTAPTPLRRVMVETTARGGARIPAEIDVLGGFRADVPSEGALRVVVELTDGRTIVGTWLPA